MSEATTESRLDNLDLRVNQIALNSQEFSDQLEQAIMTMTNIANPPPPDRAELYAALAKAQGEIQAAEAKSEAEVRKKDTNQFLLGLLDIGSLFVLALLLVLESLQREFELVGWNVSNVGFVEYLAYHLCEYGIGFLTE